MKRLRAFFGLFRTRGLGEKRQREAGRRVIHPGGPEDLPLTTAGRQWPGRVIAAQGIAVGQGYRLTVEELEPKIVP